MIAKNNTSGHTGVSYYARNNKWRVIYRGTAYGFADTLEEAVVLRAKIIASNPLKGHAYKARLEKAKQARGKFRGTQTKEQIRYASMHAEHQVLRAKYRKLMSQPVSLSREARHVFEEEYEAIRLKHYPKVSHAPQDLSSWEARRIAYEEEQSKRPYVNHELKKLPPEIVFPEYLGLSAKGQIANLRAQYRKSITDTTRENSPLSEAERQHLRQLLSFHIARVNAPKF